MFSKIIRRTHMYLALFLMPWMLVYALSTIAMNHRNFIKSLYADKWMVYEKEQEETYSRAFAADAEPRAVSRQILGDLNIDGGHYVSKSPEDGKITIYRDDPLAPRRITFDPASGRLLVEKQSIRLPNFLEEIHRRSGYGSGYAVDNAWAVSVDLVIFGMVFWVASGLWMWWELKVTRWWGAVCATAGVALFAFFLFTI